MGVAVMSKGHESKPIDERSSVSLLRYETACRAVADARAIDEVKDFRDRAIAIEAYARQAKNREMEADAIEIRMRATRRLDELIRAQAETVGLSKGTVVDGKTSAGCPITHRSDRPTLAEAGIDKNLANQARKLGRRMDEKQFEAAVEEARADAQGWRNIEEQLHRPKAAVLYPAPELPPDGIARNYSQLVALLRQQRQDVLRIAQRPFDDRIGWTEGMTGKYELPHRDDGRVAEWPNFFEWLQGLGCGLKVVPLS